ncbi:transcriptional regulator NrdR [Microgenomates group bacterium RBG_16_45_19]|nr:MAG: transcriptional regulator NrdR [Microgenomates group bacterium RBG_16_45_19]
MRCPYCASNDHGVLESRESEDGASVRRRRECNQCQKRFTTYERVEGVDLKVMKKNGSVEDFDREKVKRGLVKATWKRPIKMEQIEAIVDEVERRLRVRQGTTVRSWEIGNMVINRLKKLDPLGYLLFASVYRDFASLEDFKKEIDELLKGQAKP